MDGRLLHMGALKSAGIVASDFPFNKRGNAAVALSHLSMWTAVAERQLPHLVVVEDDVCLVGILGKHTTTVSPWCKTLPPLVGGDFQTTLRDSIATLARHAPNWDILFLGHNEFMCGVEAQRRVGWVQTPEAAHLRLTRPTADCMSGFFGYVISQSGAAKMTQLVPPLSVALDDALRPLYATDDAGSRDDDAASVNAFILQQPLVLHDFGVESDRVAVQAS